MGSWALLIFPAVSMDIYSMAFIIWVKEKTRKGHLSVEGCRHSGQLLPPSKKSEKRSAISFCLQTTNGAWNASLNDLFITVYFIVLCMFFSSTSSKKGRWNKLKVVIWYSWVIQRYVNLRGLCRSLLSSLFSSFISNYASFNTPWDLTG